MKKILYIVLFAFFVLSLVLLSGCSEQTSVMTIGYVKNEYSACISPLLEYNRDNYYFIEYDTADELKESLKAHETDCAYMSYFDSTELENSGYSPKAALAKLNAFICGVNKEKLNDIRQLDGNEIYIPENFIFTHEYDMFKYIIDSLSITVTEKITDDNTLTDYIQSEEKSFYMIVPYSADYIYFFNLDSLQKEFQLTDLWNEYISKDEPVAYVIVADEQYIKSDEQLLNLFNNFLFECDDSVTYVKNHHQKSAILCIDLGLSDNFSVAKKIISSGRFGYYDGIKLNNMIKSNMLLSDKSRKISSALT